MQKRRTRVAEGIYKDRWGLAATVKVIDEVTWAARAFA